MDRRGPPCIYMDSEDRNIRIIGISSKDPENFYKPVFSWIDQFFLTTNKEVKVVFDLSQINPLSYKVFYKLLKHLVSLYEKGNLIQIQWVFDKEDGNILDTGLYFAEIFEFPIKFKKINVVSEAV